MENWSSKRVPAKYRYLQKHIEEIWKLRESLPSLSYDFSGLKAEERDLAETYYGCILQTARKQKGANGEILSNNSPLKLDQEQFLSSLREYLKEEDISRAKTIFFNVPLTIYKGRDNIWTRENRPKLMIFLEEQQSILNWLPSGSINEKNLTWMSWEELINIAELQGYRRQNDDVRRLESFDTLKNVQKRILVRIYLEMIDSEKVTESVNSTVKDHNHRYILRKRVHLFRR